MRIHATPMLMPKAAPDFNNLLQPGEHQVGFAGERCHVEPVTNPHPVNRTPHVPFWRRIGAADAPHVFGAAFWRELVHGFRLLPIVCLLDQPRQIPQVRRLTVKLQSMPQKLRGEVDRF